MKDFQSKYSYEQLEERLEMRTTISLFGIIIYDTEDGWFPQF